MSTSPPDGQPDDDRPDDSRSPSADTPGAEIGISDDEGSSFEPEEDPEAQG